MSSDLFAPLFKAVLSAALLLMSAAAHSEVRMGVESNFVIDTNNITDNSNSLKTIVDGYGSLNFASDSRFFLTVGGLYMSRQTAASETETANLNSLMAYAGFTLSFCGRKKVCSIGAYYAPFMQAQYSETNSETETWLGSAYFAKVSLSPRLSKSVALVASVAVFGANYTTKGSEASVSTVEAFQTTTVFPMIGLQINFGEK